MRNRYLILGSERFLNMTYNEEFIPLYNNIYNYINTKNICLNISFKHKKINTYYNLLKANINQIKFNKAIIDLGYYEANENADLEEFKNMYLKIIKLLKTNNISILIYLLEDSHNDFKINNIINTLANEYNIEIVNKINLYNKKEIALNII